eukprot:NODE_736_length_4341_cov_0.251297.p1 type:complete len:170 gc:universal NODE_736_length_4341_cov_0.251297:2518-2009(-)
MIIIGCDPAQNTCAIVVLLQHSIIDMTDNGNETMLNSFEGHENGDKMDYMTNTLLNYMIKLECHYPMIKAAFVEKQGVKHGPNCIANDVYNNSMQTAIFTFFYTVGYGSFAVLPSAWKSKYNLQKVPKSVTNYEAYDALNEITNTELLATEHEWDAAMVALTGLHEMNK